MPPSLALDARVLESLRLLTGEGEPDVLVEVLGLFRDDAPRRLGAILSSLANGDAQGVHAAAHSLKGAAGNIGARALEEACRAVESAARAGDIAAVGTLLSTLEREAARVDQAIGDLMRSGR
jgi:HPt (histidine-containing phosphotransfer) domain-containing protein